MYKLPLNIDKGSEIITDGWSGYSFVKNHGYKHTVHVQSKKKDGENPLPHVHLVISLLKRWLLGTHQDTVSDKHILMNILLDSTEETQQKRGPLLQVA